MRSTLVFVHLGPKFPKYLIHNIDRVRVMHPNQEVVLVHDCNMTASQRSRIAPGVKTFYYEKEEDVISALSNHAYNANFRNGFWQISLIRLFALLQFQLATNSDHVIHIESDVVLFENFPWDKFERLENLAWLQFNQHRDVAAIFFSPTAVSARWVREKLIKAIALDNELTDMKVLSQISQEYKEQIMLLPIAPNPNSSLFMDDIPEESRLRNSISSGYFGGIFDSAPIGMWALGQDPRNHLGIARRGVPLLDSYVQPQMLTTNTADEAQLIVENEYPIFNLHVHCKDLKYFKPTNSKLAIEMVRSATRGELNSKLSISALLAIVKDFLQRHGSHTPLVLMKKFVGN